MKSYKDVYQLPLRQDKYSSWVYDNKGNFVFQFEINNKQNRSDLLDTINGNKYLTNPDLVFKHDKGLIVDNNNTTIILIRGWGNLTGSGAMNLSAEEAANIQDTFAEFIVSKLNQRN